MNETMFEFSLEAYTFLHPLTWRAISVSVFIFLPMVLFRVALPSAATGILIASYVVGVSTWLLGATVTFYTWGWIGLVVGLLLGGLGVVPIGILAAFFSLNDPLLGLNLLFTASIVVYARSRCRRYLRNIDS
jgi:hypothetical protein